MKIPVQIIKNCVLGSIGLLSCVLSNPVTAMSYSGLGVDTSLTQAKQLAFADLQQNLLVNVETQMHLARGTDIDDYYRLTSKVSSQLQLIGADADCVKVKSEHHCSVQLGQAQSELYQSKIQRLVEQINENWRATDGSQGAEKLSLLQSALIHYDQLQSLTAVYELLAPNAARIKPMVSAIELKQAITQMQTAPQSIDELAMAIAEPLKKYQRIFVKPFTPADSLEVTPFSRALHNKVVNQIDAITDRDYAFYELSGSYSYTDEIIAVDNHLVSLVRERHGDIAYASTLTTPVTAAASLVYQPKQPYFDERLLKEQIIGNEFIVQIKSNKGTRDLLFEAPESVKLMVKLNRPGYFYFVGHTKNQKTSLSYLLDLNEAPGNQKFIHYFDGDQTNRWISIGEFEVTAPFGDESIQLFASLDYPEKLLPDTKFDGTYYVIKGNSGEVLQKTRGLVRKARADAMKKTAKEQTKRPLTESPTAVTNQVKEINQETKTVKPKQKPLENFTEKNRVAEAILKFSTYSGGEN